MTAFAQDGASTESRNSNESSNLSAGGLFVEPILTYSNETSEIKTSQLPIISDDTSGTSTGYGLGARLGFHIGEVVFLAADGRYTRATFSDSSYNNAEGNVWNAGPSLGLQMPNIGLRVWGTYIAVGEFNPDSGRDGVDLKFRDPRGWRVGAGFRIQSLSLNLEYQDLVYDKTDIESFGVANSTSDTEVDYTSKGAVLSVSFPLQL